MSKDLPIHIGELSAPSRKKDHSYDPAAIKKMVEIIERNNRLIEELTRKENETHRK